MVLDRGESRRRISQAQAGSRWRKGAGSVVELGSIAAFGFSPLWLLAAASDLARGSRVYLAALVGELKDNGEPVAHARSQAL